MMPIKYSIIFEGRDHPVEIKKLEQGFELSMAGRTHRFEVLMNSSTLYSFLVDKTHVLEADVIFNQDRCELYVRNVPYDLEVYDPRRRIVSQSETGGTGGVIIAPMPGKIIEVRVIPGDKVQKDQPLVVIEAMKMQNELNAPIPGIVQEIAVKPGDAVEADQKLVIIKNEL